MFSPCTVFFFGNTLGQPEEWWGYGWGCDGLGFHPGRGGYENFLPLKLEINTEPPAQSISFEKA